MGQIDGKQIKVATIDASEIVNDSSVSGARVDSALNSLQTATSTHVSKTDNPHSVTAAQVGAIASSLKGAANGVAELDSNGKIPAAQIPSLALDRITVVADQTARYALTTATVQDGDVVKQTDTLEVFVVSDDSQLSSASGYVLISTASAAPIDSVFGRLGAVVAAAGDYNSTQVTNSSGVSGATVSAALDQLASDILASVPSYNYCHTEMSGSANGVNTDFKPRNSANSADVAAVPNETEIYLNNLWQEPGVDYSWVSSNTIARFATAPPSGWRVRIRGKY